ncbi:MAG: hypothetical protein WAM60_23780 [Candidatus Promineifilaceae bacterium]
MAPTNTPTPTNTPGATATVTSTPQATPTATATTPPTGVEVTEFSGQPGGSGLSIFAAFLFFVMGVVVFYLYRRQEGNDA